MAVRNGFLSKYNRGPCDLGFHIPENGEFSGMFTRLTTLGVVNSVSTYTNYLLFPPTYYLNRSTGTLNTSYGTHRLWSCTAEDKSNAYCFYINQNNYIGRQLDKPANGFPIRAFKDIPVEPDSSWTVLYQGTGDAGIFWNSDAGIISIVDGTHSTMTIQDHNVGATVVWQPGDTVTNNNAGLYFQWGNCNGFPYSGATMFYTVAQDVTGYMPPTNLYYNEHFVQLGSSNWFTGDNILMWGGDTGQEGLTYISMEELKKAYIEEIEINKIYVEDTQVWSSSQLKTSAEIISMANTEGDPRTNTIAELNTYPNDYYTELSTDGCLTAIPSTNNERYITATAGRRYAIGCSIGRTRRKARIDGA